MKAAEATSIVIKPLHYYKMVYQLQRKTLEEIERRQLVQFGVGNRKKDNKWSKRSWRD